MFVTWTLYFAHHWNFKTDIIWRGRLVLYYRPTGPPNSLYASANADLPHTCSPVFCNILSKFKQLEGQRETYLWAKYSAETLIRAHQSLLKLKSEMLTTSHLPPTRRYLSWFEGSDYSGYATHFGLVDPIVDLTRRQDNIGLKKLFVKWQWNEALNSHNRNSWQRHVKQLISVSEVCQFSRTKKCCNRWYRSFGWIRAASDGWKERAHYCAQKRQRSKSLQSGYRTLFGIDTHENHCVDNRNYQKITNTLKEYYFHQGWMSWKALQPD